MAKIINMQEVRQKAFRPAGGRKQKVRILYNFVGEVAEMAA